MHRYKLSYLLLYEMYSLSSNICNLEGNPMQRILKLNGIVHSSLIVMRLLLAEICLILGGHNQTQLSILDCWLGWLNLLHQILLLN